MRRDFSQASPKFGIFMCLSCSGVHRSLGVHISFVRSITMDAFKAAELARMSAGGNEAWRNFWENHESTKLEGRTWDDCTVRERYDGDVGEEYKARLTAKVEGREYVPGEERKNLPAAKPKTVIGTTGGRKVPGSGSGPSSRSGTPTGFGGGIKGSSIRSESPSLGTMGMGAGAGKKAQNEAFFARMGAENANRSEDLAPSQGGKFTGFGSDPWPPPKTGAQGIPGTDEFQQDPLAALTKSFGWFGGIVQKGVGDVQQKVGISYKIRF
jgi:ADP-ribosylation factor GTPase-activating protein 1